VQNSAYLRHGRQEPALSNTVRERLALNTMILLGQAFRISEKSITLERLGEQLNMPSLSIAPVIEALENTGLLTANEQGWLLPGKDPSHIAIDDIFATVRSQNFGDTLVHPRWHKAVDQLSNTVDMAIAKTIGTKTLSQLLDEIEDSEER
jgi:DNA-binding IscR family transcriptional regulator